MGNNRTTLWESLTLGACVLMGVCIIAGIIPMGFWFAYLINPFDTTLLTRVTCVIGIGMLISTAIGIICAFGAYFDNRPASVGFDNILDNITAMARSRCKNTASVEKSACADSHKKLAHAIALLTQKEDKEKDKNMEFKINRNNGAPYTVSAESFNAALKQLVRQKLDLSGICVSDQALSGFDFNGINLTGAAFSNVSFVDTFFSKAILYGTSFRNCRFYGKELNRALPVMQIGPFGLAARMHTVMFFEDGSTPLISTSCRWEYADKFLDLLSISSEPLHIYRAYHAVIKAVKKLNKQLCNNQTKLQDVYPVPDFDGDTAGFIRPAKAEVDTCSQPYLMGVALTREYLMALCKRAIVVPYDPNNCASCDAQQSIDLAYRRLALGTIKYRVHHNTNRNTIWVLFDTPTDEQHEDICYIQMDDNPDPVHRYRQRSLNRYVATLGPQDYHMRYIPTSWRLDAAAGNDWTDVKV